MTHKHYVYIYCDPRKKGIFTFDGIDMVFNYEPFYVGCGKEYRYRRHITNYEIDWDYNTIKNGKIKKLIEDGYDPLKYVVFYKDNISDIEAHKLEEEIILKLGRINLGTGILSNLTNGGEGWSGAISPFKGKTYEEIHGVEKAKKLKEEKRLKALGNTYGTLTKGKKMSDEQKLNLSIKKSLKVKQLDKDYNLIKIWDKSKDAADYLGISVSGIHNTLSETYHTKSAGGFYWEYIGKVNKKYKHE